MHTGTPWRESTSTVGPVVVDGRPPRGGRLVGVGRADHLQAGDRPQRRQLLDGLVRRPSSPTPTESWLNTNTTLARETDARRTGGRM